MAVVLDEILNPVQKKRIGLKLQSSFVRISIVCLRLTGQTKGSQHNTDTWPHLAAQDAEKFKT